MGISQHFAGIVRYCGGLLSVAWLLTAAPSFAAERPHIVYILADDLGWKDLGFRGGNVQTPNLDKLAAGATQLTHFYVQPFSTQTRAALLSGRYPMRYGLQTQSILPSSTYGLPPEERTLAQALKQTGYRTAFLGKWQLGHSAPEFWPTRRGFDYFYGSLSGNVPYSIKKTGKYDWRRMEQPAREDGYVTTLLGKASAAWIDKHDAATPLFLLLAFSAPQGEATAPAEFLDKYRDDKDDAQRGYRAAVTALDAAVGDVVAALEKKQLIDKTLIIFHSDNGGALPTRFTTGDGDVKKALADNDVLRDGKGSLYEGGVRGFALLHWPGKIAEKQVSADLTHVSDMFPTLVNLAGGQLEDKNKLDGVDAWPAIAERKLSARKEVLINVEDLRGAIRVGEWKLVVHAALPSRIELFQLSSDPEEAENRAERDPERLRELLGKLNAFAYDMAPAKYLDALAKPHTTEFPIYWGYNPSRR